MRGAIEMHWVMNLLEWCSFHLMWVSGNHLKTEAEIWKQELWWSSSALLKLLQSKFESRWSVFSLNMFEKSENKLMGVSIISG